MFKRSVLAILILSFFCVLDSAEARLVTAGKYEESIMNGNDIKIRINSNGDVLMGKVGVYFVRPGSLTPTEYHSFLIPRQDVPKLKAAFDKAVSWIELNKKHKKTFEKHLFTYGDLKIWFMGGIKLGCVKYCEECKYF